MNLRKYIEFITTKIVILYKEKVFYSNNQQIRYILEKEEGAKELAIVFSGCTRPGVKARYNYHRTLKDVKINKLFILDDTGINGRGAFYLGKDKNFEIARSVEKLIDIVAEMVEAHNIIYVGTSKGGYAALYFGLEKDSSIIIGAPQYFLGNYLNCDVHKNLLKYIMGDDSEESVNELNAVLKSRIKESSSNNKIYLQYSKLDHTYNEHIKYLIEDIEANNIIIEKEEVNYKHHSEVSKYFPTYLINTINKILTNTRDIVENYESDVKSIL